MAEEDSAISGPYEKFRICFCGENIRSGYVEWYDIDVSVEEACLSEKTESGTRELTPFSVTKHLPSYAALDGLIYSLGGQRRSVGGGDTLLNDVWSLDFKSLEDLKPGSGKAPDSDKAQAQSPWAVMEPVLVPGPKPVSGNSPSVEYLAFDDWIVESPTPVIVEDCDEASSTPLWKPVYDKASPTPLTATSVTATSDEDWKRVLNSVCDKAFPTPLTSTSVEDWKPVSDKASSTPLTATSVTATSDEDWKRVLNSVYDKAFPTPLTSTSVEDWKPVSDKASPTPLTARSIEDWKPGLPMNFARYNPHTMVVDHKLYVLGGFLPNQNQADGWIEVFDPEEKKWESLPSPPDQIHSSIMISGLLKSKKEIIIAKHRWDCHPLLFYSYNITTRCWNELSLHSDRKASVHSNVERTVILPPNIGRAVTVGNTLYWISTEEHNHKCTIRAYDLYRNMWFEDHLNTTAMFGRREYFSSIYSRGPGFLHLVDQKFCLLLQSSVPKKDPQSSIEYLYCVILDISPIYEHEHEDWGKFELKTVSVQKYSMDHYIDFLDCMLLVRPAIALRNGYALIMFIF